MAHADTPSETALVPAPGIDRSGEPVRHTILLVEDEEFVRNVTCEVLRFAGYEVLSARNAHEAEGMFAERKESVAALLTDVVLPGRSGGELAQELRAIQPALKVVFISGYPQWQPASPASLGSGFLYLEKPFSADVLMRNIRHALHHDGGVLESPPPDIGGISFCD